MRACRWANPGDARSGSDLEHLGAADRAGALGRRLAVLHGDLVIVLHRALGLALDAVGLCRHRSIASFVVRRRGRRRLVQLGCYPLCPSISLDHWAMGSALAPESSSHSRWMPA